MTATANTTFFVAGFGAFASAHNTQPLSEADRVARGDDPELAAEAAGHSDKELYEMAQQRDLVLMPVGSDVGWGGSDGAEH